MKIDKKAQMLSIPKIQFPKIDSTKILKKIPIKPFKIKR